jgi:TRAP-type C4-dicarboxylate transport system substrate-binding protein
MSFSFRAAGYQGEASVHTRALRHFAGTLEAQGHSSVVTPDITQLGRKATDLFLMTESGENTVMHFAASYLAQRVPSLEVFDLPFRYAGRSALLAALDGPLGDRLKAEVAEKTGFAVLGFWDNGARHLTNRLRPVHRPADCDGLSIRTMDSALHQATFAALGMIPRYIDVKDYPAAVRDRTVDAQENPYTNTLNFGIPAHHSYLTPTGHFQGISLFLANRAVLDGLPSADRAAFIDAAERATAAQRTFAADEDGVALASILGQGTKITLDWDRDAFRAATATVRQQAEARIDPAILDLLPDP